MSTKKIPKNEKTTLKNSICFLKLCESCFAKQSCGETEGEKVCFSARQYYRCKPVFDSLNEWLRGKGVKANKPLHEMRKEIGALIVTEHGIYAASRFLRHSDITTTARHYAEHKARISVGLGKLLDTEIKPAVGAA